jgi:Delta3-Delta2-enoyl-CoA isomerase
MPKLDRDGEVFILRLEPDDENRFHPDWLDAVESALDEAEGADGPRALVTAGSGKFWSNGLDLAWMSEHGEQVADFVHDVHRVTLHAPVEFRQTLLAQRMDVALFAVDEADIVH